MGIFLQIRKKHDDVFIQTDNKNGIKRKMKLNGIILKIRMKEKKTIGMSRRYNERCLGYIAHNKTALEESASNHLNMFL